MPTQRDTQVRHANTKRYARYTDCLEARLVLPDARTPHANGWPIHLNILQLDRRYTIEKKKRDTEREREREREKENIFDRIPLN